MENLQSVWKTIYMGIFTKTLTHEFIEKLMPVKTDIISIDIGTFIDCRLKKTTDKRQFALIEFYTHEAAKEAFQHLIETSSICNIYGETIRVKWAFHEDVAKKDSHFSFSSEEAKKIRMRDFRMVMKNLDELKQKYVDQPENELTHQRIQEELNCILGYDINISTILTANIGKKLAVFSLKFDGKLEEACEKIIEKLKTRCKIELKMLSSLSLCQFLSADTELDKIAEEIDVILFSTKPELINSNLKYTGYKKRDDIRKQLADILKSSSEDNPNDPHLNIMAEKIETSAYVTYGGDTEYYRDFCVKFLMYLSYSQNVGLRENILKLKIAPRHLVMLPEDELNSLFE